MQEALLGFAGVVDAHGLEPAVDYALRKADPEAADERERKRLDEADKRAARDRFFTLSPDGTGRARLSGVLGAEAAEIVNAAMEPLCRPADPHDHRTAGQRRADALTDVCALALATDQLPENRGEKARMVVNTGYRPGQPAAGPGLLDTGETLSAGDRAPAGL